MKKPYICPVIETVEYESNTALCGSCAHNDGYYDDLDTLSDALGVDMHALFSSGDSCEMPADDFSIYCKFASEGFIFLS